MNTENKKASAETAGEKKPIEEASVLELKAYLYDMGKIIEEYNKRVEYATHILKQKLDAVKE